jgi:hypothetical protein
MPLTMNTDEAVPRLVAFYETLTAQSLATLPLYYDANARFKDPFNDVMGLEPIEAIFAHMFKTLQHPRFVVTNRVVQGQQCFLTWEFRFGHPRMHAGVEQVILGASHIVLSAQGLVTLHRDYWDAAEELYEKMPVLGTLMRWLKKKASH